MKNNSVFKITKDTLISEIVEKRPDLAEKLVNEYGFHCIGCAMGEMETLEQGALAHGWSPAKIKKLVEKFSKE